MMHLPIYEELKRIAAAGRRTFYSEIAPLVELDMASPRDRGRISDILVEISRREHEAGRPLLSAVVVSQATNMPGKGFFNLAREFQLLHSGESEVAFFRSEIARVHRAWSGSLENSSASPEKVAPGLDSSGFGKHRTSSSQQGKAGNIGDVFKHACLIELFQSLATKSTSKLTYIESHSGYAYYPTDSLKNRRGEWQGERAYSLGPLTTRPFNTKGLLALAAFVDPGGCYPGSPILAMKYLPKHASLVFHDKDHEALESIREAARSLEREDSVTLVHTDDGFEEVKALLERSSKAGDKGNVLVFLDPWYKGKRGERADWENVREILCMRGADVVAWFPVKSDFPFPKPGFPVGSHGVNAQSNLLLCTSIQFQHQWLGRHLRGCGLLWANALSEMLDISKGVAEDMKRGFSCQDYQEDQENWETIRKPPWSQVFLRNSRSMEQGFSCQEHRGRPLDLEWSNFLV